MFKNFRWYATILLLLTSYFSFSQIEIVDSLKQRITEAEAPLQKATLYNDVAVAFYNNRIYYDSCYYYVEKAYQISIKNKLEEQKGRALFNFAMIYSDLGDYNKAIDFFSKAKEVFIALQDKPNVSVINSSIGALYFNKEEYAFAKTYFKDAIVISEEIKDSIGILIDYVNLAEIEYYLKEYKISKERLEYAKNLSKNLSIDYSAIHIQYGNTLFELGEKELAKNEGEIGLQMAQTDGDIKNQGEAYQLLYKTSTDKGFYEEALSYYKEYTKSKDSLKEAKQLNNVEKLKLNFELKKQQKELDYLTQKSKYQHIIYILLGLGITMLVVIIFRQLKIVRMTKNMHDIQQRLIGHELRERERIAKRKDQL